MSYLLYLYEDAQDAAYAANEVGNQIATDAAQAAVYAASCASNCHVQTAKAYITWTADYAAASCGDDAWLNEKRWQLLRILHVK